MNKNNLTSNKPTGIYDLLKVSNKKKFHLSAASRNLTEAMERIETAARDIAVYSPHWLKDTSNEFQELLDQKLRTLNSELLIIQLAVDKWYKTSSSSRYHLMDLLEELTKMLNVLR